MSRLTCTDCIHDYVCHNLNNLNYWNKDDPNGDPMDKFCLCFKNKQLFIELPCKLGDTVYCLNYTRWKEDGKYKYKEFWVRESFLRLEHIPYFGKTVFLTKAEAEAKLAELKGLWR